MNRQQETRLAKSVLAVGLLTGLCASAAETQPSSARLRALGFKDTSYLLATEGTVGESLDGDLNLEVNAAAKNGAVVTLDGANGYTGGTYVRSGTLVVPSAASLGSSTLPIVLGSGTLRFTDDVTQGRDITALPADLDTGAANPDKKAPAILCVDAGKTVTLNGRYYQNATADNFNNVYKTGPGTFVLASASGANDVGRDSGYLNDWDWPSTLVPFTANGDSPRKNEWGFGVFDGTFVVDTAADVKTTFKKFCVGGSTTTTGTETAGHFKVKNGKVTTGDVALGYYNGNKTTAPSGLASSFTVSGGEVDVIGDFSMAWSKRPAASDAEANTGKSTDVTNATSRAKLTVSGGELRIKNNLKFGTPFGMNEWGSVTVSGGGKLTTGNVTMGDAGYRGQKVQFTLSDTAVFAVTNKIVLRDVSGPFKVSDYYKCFAKSDYNTCRVFINGQSTFVMRDAEDPTTYYYPIFRIYGRGGTLKWLSTTKDFYTGSSSDLMVSATGLTIDISDFASVTPKFRQTILRNGSTDNGVVKVVGAGKALCLHQDKVDPTVSGFSTDNARILLGGRTSYAPTFTVTGDGAIGACGWCDAKQHTVTVAKLVFGKTGTLEIGHASEAGDAPSLLVASAMTPPTDQLNVVSYKDTGKEEYAPVGTFDILKFPSSVSFDAKKCRYAGACDRRTHNFYTVTSGGWTTLKMRVSKFGLALLVR